MWSDGCFYCASATASEHIPAMRARRRQKTLLAPVSRRRQAFPMRPEALMEALGNDEGPRAGWLQSSDVRLSGSSLDYHDLHSLVVV